MISIKAIFAALPLLVSAINITAPIAGSLATKGSSLTVEWTSVDTDPTSFGILLVNFVNWPPTYTQLAYNVPVSEGSTTVRIPCDTISTDGYQINAINGTNTYVIYAQSAKFSVAGAACIDPFPPVPTCIPSIVTVTSVPSAKAVKKTYGKVPKVIGYGPGGYSSPVTLASVPTAPATAT